MKLIYYFCYFLGLSLAGAYLVSPPGTAAPGTAEDCTQWVEYSSDLTCAWIETLVGMTEVQFEEWNPIVTELDDSCTLLTGLYYCVQVNLTTISVSSVYPIPTTGTSSTNTSSSTSSAITTTSTPITTPTPIEPGIIDGCTSFHLVVSGDTYADIASPAGVSLTEFVTWNPNVV
ncbi:hypothetical protein BDV11DRAFT_175600 [Aspergillus similis]